MIVNLTFAEWQMAHHVAGQRAVYNLKKQAKPRYGAVEGAHGEHISAMGTVAEMAVAKEFNLFWSGAVGNYDAVDVGGLVEVRGVEKKHHCLIMHKEDKDGLPYVLAHVDGRTVEMLGWILAVDGKKDEWWSDPAKEGRHAYFIPQKALSKMDALVGDSDCLIERALRTSE